MLDSKKYKTKQYPHFDHKVKIEDVESYVINPEKIAKHSFLPFLHYKSSYDKNIGVPNPKFRNRPIDTKKRDIMYAGHLDSFIYKYYAEDLNRRYDQFMDENKIDECSTAYRYKKHGQSNIEFAAEVINAIVQYNEAYIIVGDFTKYFDRIDHYLLKQRLLKVLKVSRLSNDWFNIYRSITKYGYYKKSCLIERLKNEDLFNEGSESYFKSVKDFRKFQKKHSCIHNDKSYGVPQGTAISVVFANVYAIEFDIQMQQQAKKYNGIYRRYSDDFVLVIPKNQNNESLSYSSFYELEKIVRDLAEKNKIKLQESKTELLEYKKNTIYSVGINSTKYRLDYLGFIFDGTTVKMRGKSPYKFYRKAKTLISRAYKVKRKKNLKRLPYRKQIYGLYTDMGLKRGKYGNFITYAMRAQESFDALSPNTENLLMNQIKNRKKKIEKILGVRIHTRI